VLIDPRDGAPLEIGRTSYRIPKTLRQWLRLRDGKCPFPGCNNQSLDNDADHLLAWARGGTTGISNLGQPCPKHHRLRHATAWTPTGANAHEPPGWTSPTGRRYPSEQPDWEPPRWPAALLAMAKSLDPGASARPDYDRDLAMSEFPGRDRDLDLGMLDNLLPDDPLPDWDLPPQPLDDALAGDPFSDLWLLLTSGACKDSQDCAAPAQAAA
jgi:hypothetical protein